jgi:hypothetical protein
VIITYGIDKGLSGYVSSHNYIWNTFLIHLVNGRLINFAVTDFEYLLVCL